MTAADLNRNAVSDRFIYYRCRQCALIFLSPLPPDLSGFYPGTYHEIPCSLEALKSDIQREAFKLDAIAAHVSGGDLLEIGPSYGRFAFIAKAAGYRVDALEMDPACCAFLNEAVGVRAFHTSNVVESARSLGMYDAIALWHALEHVPDPWALLDLLSAKLKPRGVLAISSPNPCSLQFRLFGRYWVHLDAPRHVELIPASTLTQRLERRGLERVHYSTSDQGAQDCNGLGWHVSPHHWLGRIEFDRVTSYLVRKLIQVGSRMEKFPGLGAAYTLVFRKS